jgi:hypothetical protein
MRAIGLFAGALLAAPTGAHLAAQDANIRFPVARVETLLRDSAFRPVAQEGARFKGDRTQHVLLAFDSSTAIEVKWAPAPPGGEAFNNQPRFEAAAYALQKLFLDERDYVVPPTVLRMVSPAALTGAGGEPARATFSGIPHALVALQYWTSEVTPEQVFDAKRAERDSVYARHLGDLNILTYLIRHRDANKGNVLLSVDSVNPRLFSVDNGVAFSSPPSDRGRDWEQMRVKRVSAATAARLKAITDDQLQSLGVLAQFEPKGDAYQPVALGPNLDAGRGVRRKGQTIQLGLTKYEIDAVRGRLRSLIKQIEEKKIRTF